MAVDTAILYKLIILYMLNKVDFPLTNAQILNFFLEKEYTTYFSFQECINDLTENGFVFADSIRNASYYHLTSEGRQTLEYFGNRISSDIIDDIDMYLIKNKYELRNEVGTLSDYYRSSVGDYIVHCQVKEGNATVIELNVSVPTKDDASAMCARWKDASTDIYQYVMMNLMKKNEKNAEDDSTEMNE